MENKRLIPLNEEGIEFLFIKGMKIGKRTQAYFVGFLIGIAIVSVLIDSRRDRAIENKEETVTWERIEGSLPDLPAAVIQSTGAEGHVTGVAEFDEKGVATGKKGYFFANANGRRFWYYGSDGQMKLYDGEKFAATSQPGLEWDLMRAGFEHQGHKVISRRAVAPEYVLEIDVHSAIDMADAYQNLLSKSNYVAEVGWIEVGAETEVR